MKVAIVLRLDVEDVDEIPAALTAIDPPNVPRFTGEVNIVVPPHADNLYAWLDEEE